VKELSWRYQGKTIITNRYRSAIYGSGSKSEKKLDFAIIYAAFIFKWYSQSGKHSQIYYPKR
jgi:hypothetical protein